MRGRRFEITWPGGHGLPEREGAGPAGLGSAGALYCGGRRADLGRTPRFLGRHPPTRCCSSCIPPPTRRRPRPPSVPGCRGRRAAAEGLARPAVSAGSRAVPALRELPVGEGGKKHRKQRAGPHFSTATRNGCRGGEGQAGCQVLAVWGWSEGRARSERGQAQSRTWMRARASFTQICPRSETDAEGRQPHGVRA